MKKQFEKIGNLPIVLWGKPSDKIIIAVHGYMSNKCDIPIEILASIAINYNYQVISFDLPEHGERKFENTKFKINECINDLKIIIDYVKTKWKHINLFANSIGTYLSILAYCNENIEKALFLSPIVNMEYIIKNLIDTYNVNIEELKNLKEIRINTETILYWEDYCYTKENKIYKWNIDTYILYGSNDFICNRDIIDNFVKKFNCKLDIIKDGEHYFYTKNQLDILENWIKKLILN